MTCGWLAQDRQFLSFAAAPSGRCEAMPWTPTLDLSHERTKANYCFCKRPCAPKAITYDDQRFASSDLDGCLRALRAFKTVLIFALSFQISFRQNVSVHIK